MSEELVSKIHLISQRLEFIEKYITSDRDKFEAHIKTSDDFRFKVTTHEEQIRGIKSEINLMKWMLGIVITVGLGIFLKLITT